MVLALSTLKYVHTPSQLEPPINVVALIPVNFFLMRMKMSKETLCNIFTLWKNALINFLNGNYIAHDALVGENACHIRACILIDLILHKEKNINFHRSIEKLLIDLDRLISLIQEINQNIEYSIADFFQKNAMNFYIDYQFVNSIMFIINTFILTLTKERLPSCSFVIQERTSYKKLQAIGLSYSQAKYFVRYTQENLSAYSCAYIQSEASYLDNDAISLLLTTKKDQFQRSYLPLFFVAKVILFRKAHQNTSIILNIKRHIKNIAIDDIVLHFKPNLNKTDFVIHNTIDEDKPCIVLSAIVNYDNVIESIDKYKSRVIHHSFVDIILSNFASHQQYSGELSNCQPPFNEAIEFVNLPCNSGAMWINKEFTNEFAKELKHSILKQKESFERYKQLAVKEGCCLDNPSLLVLNHIYCDKLSNYSITQQFLNKEFAEA